VGLGGKALRPRQCLGFDRRGSDLVAGVTATAPLSGRLCTTWYYVIRLARMPPMPESAAGPETIAHALWKAEVEADPIEPLFPADQSPSLTDAYRIQTAGLELRLREGDRVVGRKVGLTSPAMQEMLGVDQPDFGYLLDSMVVSSGSTIETDRLIAPRVEGEIAFFLDADLAGPEVDSEQVLRATSAIGPALEVIDSRIVDWRIAIADTIADNASSGMAILGEKVSLGDLDLASVELSLDVDGEVVTGRGDAVLGHPAAAVAWLANALAEFGGESLAAGQVVLPGAMAKAVAVARGSTARASFAGIGDVVANFN
jgi:2-keto-4-pentenoate hydratase